MKFGIEYETCVIIPEKEVNKKDWVKSILPYIKRIREDYKSLNADEKDWCASFENTVLINDGDTYIFNISDDSEYVQIDGNIIYEYKYPLLTVDTTIRCHNTCERKPICTEGQKGEYNLNTLAQGLYTVNLEIVSQILTHIRHFDFFYKVFIKEDMFLINKSQGIHLNVSFGETDDTKIRNFIMEHYIQFEKNKKAVIRPENSNWAKVFNQKKIANLSNLEIKLNSILDKQSSIKIKRVNSEKILEFRLFSPSGGKSKESMLELLIDIECFLKSEAKAAAEAAEAAAPAPAASGGPSSAASGGPSPAPPGEPAPAASGGPSPAPAPAGEPAPAASGGPEGPAQSAMGGRMKKTKKYYRKHKKTMRRKKHRKGRKTLKTRKPKGIYVFVYGSLRKDLQNASIMESSKYLGVYKTTDKFYMIGTKSKVYPYVLKNKIHDSLEETQITGELYEVTQEKLDRLDVLEGHPHSYRRELVRIYNPDKNSYEEAYMYILVNEEHLRDIPHGIGRRFVTVNDGDWKKYYMTH